MATTQSRSVEAGERYRCRAGQWSYLVESIVDHWVYYTVVGGRDDGRKGKGSLRDFVRRVFDRPLPKKSNPDA